MSEFERAVFRVYENTIDGVNFDGIHTNITTKLIKIAEILFRFLALFSFFIMIFLHIRFVGDHKLNCIPDLLAEQNEIMASSGSGYGSNVSDSGGGGQNVFFNFTDDYILHLNVYRPEDEIQNMKVVQVNGSDEFVLVRKKPDFEYAKSSAVLSLNSEIQKKFYVVNLTIPHEECFGKYPLIGGSIYGLVAYFDGVGTVLMNDLMYASKSEGVLKKYTGDRARWSSNDFHDDDKDDMYRSSMMSFLFTVNEFGWLKIGILLKTALAFFLLSTSTAMLIRILLSSGVIILYPILLVLECVFSRGVSMRTAYRLMTLAYPWLGLPMEILRSRRISAIPFLIGHATQILVYYIMYEGVQILIAMWIYDHSMPDLMDVWLYSVMMMAEYYSIVYVRSVASIRFFPRFFAGFFAIYHIYVFSFPGGFHSAAMMSFSAATFSLLLFSLRKMEYPAYMRGDITIDRPRGLFNSLPYTYNGIFLPPEFTTFMPVNRRSRGVYDNEVSSDEGGGNEGDDEEALRDDLAMHINPTETPLLYHHHNLARRTSTGGVSTESRRDGTGSGDSSSYYSLSPPIIAPSGRRRRRRRHRHHHHQRSASASGSEGSDVNQSDDEENGNGRRLSTDSRSLDLSEDDTSETQEDDYGSARNRTSNSRANQREDEDVITRGLRMIGLSSSGSPHGNYHALDNTESHPSRTRGTSSRVQQHQGTASNGGQGNDNTERDVEMGSHANIQH